MWDPEWSLLPYYSRVPAFWDPEE